MEEKIIRNYAKIMQELGLSVLEVEEYGGKVRLERPCGAPAAAPVPVAAAAEPATEPASTADYLDVSSPMVGVFYSAPAENAAPFVRVGDVVHKGDVLCIIEAMKLMNEIAADMMCVVREVCVENAQPVEFGQPLFYVEPVDSNPASQKAGE